MKPHRTGRRRAGLGVVALLLGAALTVMGFGGPDQYALILGPTIAATGLGMVLVGRVPTRAIVSVVSVFSLVWSTASVPISTTLGAPLDIPLFLVQGLLMSAAAITLVVTNEDVVARASRRGSAATRCRCGSDSPTRWPAGSAPAMTLGMFSIVVLTLVFMSQMTYMFNTQADTFARELSGGFGAVITANPSSPIPPERARGGARRHPGRADVVRALAAGRAPARSRSTGPPPASAPSCSTHPPPSRTAVTTRRTAPRGRRCSTTPTS